MVRGSMTTSVTPTATRTTTSTSTSTSTTSPTTTPTTAPTMDAVWSTLWSAGGYASVQFQLRVDWPAMAKMSAASPASQSQSQSSLSSQPSSHTTVLDVAVRSLRPFRVVQWAPVRVLGGPGGVPEGSQNSNWSEERAPDILLWSQEVRLRLLCHRSPSSSTTSSSSTSTPSSPTTTPPSSGTYRNGTRDARRSLPPSTSSTSNSTSTSTSTSSTSTTFVWTAYLQLGVDAAMTDMDTGTTTDGGLLQVQAVVVLSDLGGQGGGGPGSDPGSDTTSYPTSTSLTTTTTTTILPVVRYAIDRHFQQNSLTAERQIQEQLQVRQQQHMDQQQQGMFLGLPVPLWLAVGTLSVGGLSTVAGWVLLVVRSSSHSASHSLRR